MDSDDATRRQRPHLSAHKWLSEPELRPPYRRVEDSIPILAARLDELDKIYPFLSRHRSQIQPPRPYSPVGPISTIPGWSQNILRPQSPEPHITMQGIPPHGMAPMPTRGGPATGYIHSSISPFPIVQHVAAVHLSAPPITNPAGPGHVAVPNAATVTEVDLFNGGMNSMAGPGAPETENLDGNCARSGRRGKFQCDQCRSAKRNYECTPIDPGDPSSKCTKCRDRKILDKCTGLRWPPAKADRLRIAELRTTTQSQIAQLTHRVNELQDKFEQKTARLTKMVRKILLSRAREIKFK